VRPWIRYQRSTFRDGVDTGNQREADTSTDTVDVKKIKELIEKHPDNKTLLGVLNALQAAYTIKQEIGDLPLKGVEVVVKLGVPPLISVEFVSSAQAAK
jgi:hypothetical protein